MFEQSLLQAPARARRSATAIVSYCLEACLVALLVLIPLLRSVALPTMNLHVFNIPLGRPHPPAAAQHQQRPRTSTAPAPKPRLTAFLAPPSIPHTIDMRAEPPSVPESCAGCVPGIGQPNGIRDVPELPVNLPVPPPPPKPAPTPTHRLVISRIEPGALIRQVQPAYPPAAKMTRIQGPVELAAVIARDGSIANLRVVSGHPMLVKAAIDAVSQWRYRPYILNGEAVEVETRITVNFTLSQ